MAAPAVLIEGPISGPELPFRSVRNRESSLYVDLDAVGYVEEEYFIQGQASHGEAEHHYITRLLVRRPAAAQGFSGVVHLEAFHMLNEDNPAWSNAHRYVLRAGDAWVGVTVNSGAQRPSDSSMPGGLTVLKEADPARYRLLHLPEFAPEPLIAERPGPAGFDPEEMQRRMAAATALGPAIAGDIANLLKSRNTPVLGGGRAERIYATGWSQTGVFWRDYLQAGRHELDRLSDGRPAIDGYLVAVATGVKVRPSDAVLVQLFSETEAVGLLRGPATVDDDSDAPRFRGYEVPGSFHLWHVPARVAANDAHPDVRHNDRAWWVIVHAILAGLDRWVATGEPMPRAPRIERDSSAPDGLARDRYGNARGGVRTPWLDAPDAHYDVRCPCSIVVGARRPLERPVDRERFAAAAAAMVKEGFLLEEDRAAVL